MKSQNTIVSIPGTKSKIKPPNSPMNSADATFETDKKKSGGFFGTTKSEEN